MTAKGVRAFWKGEPSLPFQIGHALSPILPIVLVGILQGCIGIRPFDDAYITYRYARNLSQGLGFIYNPGQRVLGTTSPLHALLLAGVGSLVSPTMIPSASFLIAILADGISGLLFFKILRRVLSSQFAGLLGTLTFLLQPLRADVAVGGMETSLYTTGLLLLHWTYLADKSAVSIGLISASLIMTRPDAVLAIVPIFAFLWARDRRKACRAAFLAALALLPWLVFATLYFGGPVPNTIVAKSTAYRNSPAHALGFLLLFLGTGTIELRVPLPLILILASLGLGALSLGVRAVLRDCREATPICLYPLLYCTALAAVNSAMWFPWYYVPIMPSIILTIFAGLSFKALPQKQRNLVRIATGLILLLIPATIYALHPPWHPVRSLKNPVSKGAAIISRSASPGDLVFAPDIGLVGWELAEAEILDPIGLVTPGLLPYILEIPPGEWISPRLLRDYNPGFLIASDYALTPALKNDEYFHATYCRIWISTFPVPSGFQTVEVYRLCSNPGPLTLLTSSHRSRS